MTGLRYGDQKLIVVNYYLSACADPQTCQGKHLGLSPACSARVPPSRRRGSGKLARPGQAR
jgi:hypothetical protein